MMDGIAGKFDEYVRQIERKWERGDMTTDKAERLVGKIEEWATVYEDKLNGKGR